MKYKANTFKKRKYRTGVSRNGDTVMIKVSNSSLEQLEEIYNIYCENNLEFDDILDLPVIPQKAWAMQDFFECLDKKNTRCLSAEELVDFQQNGRNAVVKVKVLRGFAVYEIKPDIFEILHLEAQNKNFPVYNFLLKDLVAKLRKTEKQVLLRITVEDGRYDLLKAVMDFGFVKKDFISSKEGSDLFIFEKKV